MRVSQAGSLATVPNVCSPYVLWGRKSGKAFLFLWLASPLHAGAKCQARYSLAHSEGGPGSHLEDSWGSGIFHVQQVEILIALLFRSSDLEGKHFRKIILTSGLSGFLQIQCCQLQDCYHDLGFECLFLSSYRTGGRVRLSTPSANSPWREEEAPQ